MAWDEYRASYDAFDLLASPDRHRMAARFAAQTAVAVSHAGFVVASILVTFDIPRPGTGAHLEPAHTLLTECRVADATWTLVRYNDASHLPRQRASQG